MVGRESFAFVTGRGDEVRSILPYPADLRVGWESLIMSARTNKERLYGKQ